jgi:uncharacterized protein
VDYQAIWLVVAVLIVLIGLLGTILPALPGLPLMFIGMLLAAWITDFALISWPTLVILLLIVLLGLAVDVGASIIGARKLGASKKATWGAAIGSVIGFFVGGIYGLLLGPLLGAAAGEQIHGGDWKRSAKVGLGTWLGLAVGGILKLVLAFAMIAVFAISWFLI